jgi:hypothetical protein
MQDVLRTYKLLTLTKGVNSGRCVMAEGILKALQGTPIPTILVVAGIVFLLLSIAGQLAGRIVVPPERQRQAAIIGGLLLVVGVALNIAPPQWLPSKPSNDSGVQPSHDTEPSSSGQKTEIKPPPGPGQEFPTKYPGVMASIARFRTSGAFIILEITVKNGTNKDVRRTLSNPIRTKFDKGSRSLLQTGVGLLSGGR